MNETQYTDEIKLVVVDHPVNVQTIPGPQGKIYTISNPIPPVRAYDQLGNDLSGYVCQNDGLLWTSYDDDKNPDNKNDMKDELILEFPKPPNASKAKLIFNGCNTLWGSQSIRRYLDLHGKQVSQFYREIKNSGPAFYKILNMTLREELYALNIRVETDNGWQTKGMLMGGGPFAMEDKIYTLNLEDVTGETLRIKLTPPALFWMINYVAIDYSEDMPVESREIEAISAEDHYGKTVKTLFATKDDNYHVMPNIGDAVELVFNAPPKPLGMKRTVLLKASGYYDIHLKAEGERQEDLLERIHSEPGFFVQYAFKEYAKWRNKFEEKR